MSTVSAALQRLAGLLPAGTVATGGGVAVLGLAAYVHLAFAGHGLGQAEMANLSVLWAVVFTLGLGVFFPVEQEVTRLSAGRHATEQAAAAVWRRGTVVSCGLFGVFVVMLGAGATPLAHRLYSGDVGLVLVTLAGLLGLAVAAPARGVAAGTARFDLYGRQLGLDGLLRVLLAALLALLGARSAAAYGAVLAIAPLLATLVLLAPLRRASGSQVTQPAHAPHSAPSTGAAGVRASGVAELGRGLAPLVVSALLGQFILNSAVISVRLIDPERVALAAAMLAALILTRVPLFVFAAVQASLLSGLASSVATGAHTYAARLLRHACVVVTALAALAAVPAIVAGPWLTQLLFAAPAVLGRADFALLATGTWAFMLALVLGQGAMALRHHRVQMAAWIAGAAALALVTLVPGDLALRVEVAYAAANATVAAGLALILFRSRILRA